MCWFTGTYSQRKNKKLESIFNEAIKKIKHRGKYQVIWNYWEYNIWYHRLKTDINGIAIKEESYIENIVFNGIIYNVQDLKQMFHLSESNNFDTLVIKAWYKKSGIKFLEKLRWMFTFAYNDEKNIHLIRDTIWIKPLYYVLWKWIFAFSSEMKWLTIFCREYRLEIIEVLPGEIIKYNKANWLITKEKFYYKRCNKLDWFKLLQESFSTSLIAPTLEYMQGEKEIAILLSWWLDSSILLYSLFQNQQIDKRRIKVFCLSITWSSDRKATKIIEEDLGIQVNYIEPFSAEDSISKIEEVVRITESPLARVVKVWILQYSLAQKIREQKIDIVISWEWSDEIFYWYKRFYKDIKNEKMIPTLFSNFFENIFFYTLLQRLDRVFSHFTIESRVPFLDQELVSWVEGMKIENKLHGWKNKYILREYARHIWLPESIVQREKEKMTKWVTKQENNYTQNLCGYLENICYDYSGEYLSDICLKYYKKYYYQEDTNVHSQFEWFQTEQDIELLFDK